MTEKVPIGTWVEAERVLLTPDQRAPQVPEDTKITPYLVRVAGFLQDEGELGARVRVKTLIGRTFEGTLRLVNPSYSHTFGTAIPELLNILPNAENV